MNKRRTQLLLMITVLVMTLTIVFSFGYYSYGNLREQIVSQILEDNKAMGEHLFQLFTDDLYQEKSPEEQLKFLQEFSDRIQLPNGGFICALEPGGGVVVFPGLKPDDKMSIGGFTIHDKENEYSGTFQELESGKSFAGILEEPDMSEQIIYSQPLGDSPLRLNVHQKMHFVHERIKELLFPSLIAGIVVAVLGAILVYLISNQIVHSYESQLEKLNENLLEVNRDRTQLLRVISHDLSNPLQVIQMASGFMLEDISDAEELQENIEMVAMGVQKAQDIITLNRELLALEENKKGLDLKVVSLEDEVQHMKKMLKGRLQDKEVTLHCDIEQGITVKVEPISFLNSVLNNILTNAIKFSFPKSSIAITAKSEGAYAHIAIKDSGIGMSKELIEKLFHPHEKTHRAGTGNESGTGFGMPIMKKFVEHYGGTVDVESAEGKEDQRVHGTTFHLRIPSGK